jgi:hypothetical protein
MDMPADVIAGTQMYHCRTSLDKATSLGLYVLCQMFNLHAGKVCGHAFLVTVGDIL